MFFLSVAPWPPGGAGQGCLTFLLHLSCRIAIDPAQCDDACRARAIWFGVSQTGSMRLLIKKLEHFQQIKPGLPDLFSKSADFGDSRDR